MTDEVKNILHVWEREIADEIVRAYPGVLTCKINIHVVEEFNYMVTLSVEGIFDYTDATHGVVSVTGYHEPATYGYTKILIDQAYLQNNAYNAIPVRDIIELMYRKCNGYCVETGERGNPWGHRRGFKYHHSFNLDEQDKKGS